MPGYRVSDLQAGTASRTRETDSFADAEGRDSDSPANGALREWLTGVVVKAVDNNGLSAIPHN